MRGCGGGRAFVFMRCCAALSTLLNRYTEGKSAQCVKIDVKGKVPTLVCVRVGCPNSTKRRSGDKRLFNPKRRATYAHGNVHVCTYACTKKTRRKSTGYGSAGSHAPITAEEKYAQGEGWVDGSLEITDPSRRKMGEGVYS